MNIFELPIHEDTDNIKSEPFIKDVTEDQEKAIFNPIADKEVKQMHYKRPPGVPDKDQLDAIHAQEKKRKLEAPVNGTMTQYLKSTPALQLPREKREIITVKSTHSMKHIFRVLVENKILSVPVYDKEMDTYLGFVDMLDIVTAVVSIEKNNNVNIDDTIPLLEHEMLFTCTDIGWLIGASKRNPFIPLAKGATMYDVLKVLALKKVHRVPLIDDEYDTICGIASQSVMIKALFENLDRCQTLASKTVQQLQLGLKPVVSVTDTATAREAFEKMLDKRVTGVAIVDKNNHIVGQISSTDIKAITPNAGLFELIYLPVTDFTKRIQTSADSVICCSSKDTLYAVMKKIAENNIHRIFIVDEHKKLIGVISLGDILEVFLEEDITQRK